ncbi:MAG: tyrosine decarboxylase MfnA [Thermoplasmatota archaeon]
MKPDVRRALQKAHEHDRSFASGRILGSMCTEPHPVALAAYREFMETNLGDPTLFPGTKKLERQVVDRVGELLHAPATMDGQMTSGGTESNLTALWIHTQLRDSSRVVVPEHAHFSFQKAASLMDLELKTLPCPGHVADAGALPELLDDDVACVVAVAGTTNLGLVDPVEAMARCCNEAGVPLHVDAAFGGFVLPFLRQLGLSDAGFDFSIDGVSSMSLDPHKMGMSVIPAGLLLLRHGDRFERIAVRATCTHTRRQLSLLGTRPGAAAAATYAVLHELGWDGYRSMVAACMETTRHAVERISEAGFALVVEPETNVLAVRVDKPRRTAEQLAERGWMVGVNERDSALRLVVMPHVKKTLIDSFVSDLKKVTA